MSVYNPTPTRVWYRVQNRYTQINDPNESDLVYMPLTKKFVTRTQAAYETQMNNKANILQYKHNSASITKTQLYSQFARGVGPNRRKVFATQTQTYTNPNSSNMLRVRYTTINTDYPDPNNCNTGNIKNGGTLICGTLANQCTSEIYKNNNNTGIICNESSSSNVPGNVILCQNTNLPTWYPRTNYTMNTSTNKWPQGYKGFVSAITNYTNCYAHLYHT